MIYRYLFILLCFASCNEVTRNAIQSDEPTKEELHKEYIFNLHNQNIEEAYINQDFVNILSVKYNIADSICTEIIVDYLNVVNNQKRNYTNEYKVETIKNYAFENDLQEEQVANLLEDYFRYSESKKYYSTDIN